MLAAGGEGRLGLGWDEGWGFGWRWRWGWGFWGGMNGMKRVGGVGGVIGRESRGGKWDMLGWVGLGLVVMTWGRGKREEGRGC